MKPLTITEVGGMFTLSAEGVQLASGSKENPMLTTVLLDIAKANGIETGFPLLDDKGAHVVLNGTCLNVPYKSIKDVKELKSYISVWRKYIDDAVKVKSIEVV